MFDMRVIEPFDSGFCVMWNIAFGCVPPSLCWLLLQTHDVCSWLFYSAMPTLNNKWTNNFLHKIALIYYSCVRSDEAPPYKVLAIFLQHELVVHKVWLEMCIIYIGKSNTIRLLQMLLYLFVTFKVKKIVLERTSH